MTSPITIVPVTTKRQMRKFVDFSIKLFWDCPHYVPELAFDTLATLNPKKNPSFEFCEAQPYLAYRDNKIVGRVVAIVNYRANERWGYKQVRFGWIDFIEDYEVLKALLDTVVAWGKERGMTTMEGPNGFTDFDREGALTYGFDRFATMATIYNPPYYIDYYHRYGLVKSVEWVEKRITVPDQLDKHVRMKKIIEERYGITVKKCKSHRKFSKIWAHDVFHMLNDCYRDLHNFSKLSDAQIDKYIDDYLPWADLDLIPLIVDSAGNLVGTGLMIPSLAEAIHKAHGKLFPFGWWHLLKSLFIKHSDTVEFLLIAVRPEFQGKGVNSLIMSDLLEVFHKKGFKYCETNCLLEDNFKVINLWNALEHEDHKRRQALKMDI
ncbi:MAG: GNAT family N-acetyltransferase [Bacteroidales bacterium]|nr:GNAT family N-acetyltransferase [Bacteroidales bacterium]